MVVCADQVLSHLASFAESRPGSSDRTTRRSSPTHFFFFFTQLVPRDPFVRETRKRTFTQAKFPAIALAPPASYSALQPQTHSRPHLFKTSKNRPSVQLASAKYGYRRGLLRTSQGGIRGTPKVPRAVIGPQGAQSIADAIKSS
eukprot:g7790.t1